MSVDQEPVEPAEPPTAPTSPPPPAVTTGDLSPEKLRDELSKVRHESATYRTRLREANEQLQKFGPDADATLKARDAEIRELKIGKALAESFHRHGAAKPTLVRAYLTEAGMLGQFDPSAADFLEHVDTIVSETLEQNPELRSSRRGPRSVSTPLRRAAASGAALTGRTRGDVT